MCVLCIIIKMAAGVTDVVTPKGKFLVVWEYFGYAVPHAQFICSCYCVMLIFNIFITNATIL